MIHLIRHARPTITGVLLGQLDAPLDSQQELSPSALTVASIVSSPLRRALETAELLFPDRKIRVIPELAEISLGAWDGKSWSEIEAAWPDLAEAKRRDWTNAVPPGGEGWQDFESRVAAAWRCIRSLPSPCAVVAHAGVNAVLAKLIIGNDPFQFHQEYGEVTSIEIL